MFRILMYISLCLIPIQTIGQLIHTDLENFIANVKDKFYSKDESLDYLITHNHKSTISGINHYYLCQTVGGIEIKNAIMSVHIDTTGLIVEHHNQFISQVKAKINTSNPQISSYEALRVVAYDLGIDEEQMPIDGLPGLGMNRSTNYGMTSMSRDPIQMKLKYHILNDSVLRLAWETTILENTKSDYWSMLIDAMTGDVLAKENLTLYCDFPSRSGNHQHSESCVYSRHSSRSDVRIMGFSQLPNSYNVFPLSVESPIHGNRTIEVSPHNLIASPFGWHDIDGNPGPEYLTTRGNNVHAKEDTLANNNEDIGYSPNGGPNLTFDFPWNEELRPKQNLDASITNLFYWNNIVHDVLYHYGFTESAGNFQKNNYGRGGIENDHVRADALDGSGTNNANFSTPVDGINPRMQMLEWYDNNENTSFTVVHPAQKAGNYPVVKASFGPSIFSISGQVILGDPLLACNPISNILTGKIAMLDRGDCEFGGKALRAQNAGAIGVIICNNLPGDDIITMGSGAQGAHVTIPSVMISQRSCDTLKLYLSNLNVSLNANLGPSFDSGLDNGIIAHEYGHGLTKRLTGGAGNSTCLSNEEQMGEGWSDYLSLILTAKTSDTSIKKRGIGTYLINQPTDGNGIRPYPYTTDMTLNPMTYGNIKTLTAPHHLGSVWCTMLWDMTWLFQDNYGFSEDLYQGDGGNNMVLALIVEALKLQPCQPGFVTGRNAILKADSLINGGAHSCLIWKAFARRGLGASASQGSAYDKNDGVEAFDMPITCRNIVTSTDHIGVGSLRYGIENAMSGDTIKFAPYLEGKDFDLIADPIIINKNLALINSFESNLLLNFSEHGMFEISVGSNVLLDGVKFFKSNSLNPFISNNGSLTLKNVTVGGTQSVINAGTIKVIGQTDIKN